MQGGSEGEWKAEGINIFARTGGFSIILYISCVTSLLESHRCDFKYLYVYFVNIINT